MRIEIERGQIKRGAGGNLSLAGPVSLHWHSIIGLVTVSVLDARGMASACSIVRARDRAMIEGSRDRQGPDPRTIVKHAEKRLKRVLCWKGSPSNYFSCDENALGRAIITFVDGPRRCSPGDELS